MNDKIEEKGILKAKEYSNYEFVFEKENGEKVNCELLFNFYLKDKDKNYMIFTDNTYDENNNLMVYSYYTSSSDDTLIPVTDNSEYNMVNEVYKTVLEKVK